MRRKPGTYLPSELSVLRAALALTRRQQDTDVFHGYGLAEEIESLENADARTLTRYGNLYRILDRLELMGLLSSAWEDPMIAAREERPRRRLYSLTAAGRQAAQTAPQAAASPQPQVSTNQRQPSGVRPLRLRPAT